MNKMKNLMFLSIAMLVTGCKDQYKECPKLGPYVYTYGYDSSEIDTISVSYYQKNSNFSIKSGESYFLLIQSGNLKLGKDSFYFTGYNDYNCKYIYQNEYEKFDWRYIIVSTGDIFNIVNAEREVRKTEVNHPDPACSSPINRLELNGKSIIIPYGQPRISFFKP